MPGTTIRALRDSEAKNPVFLIDEIDKMGTDFCGDPASAMLEELDPEQHSTFRDHYIDLPFDLSKVLFIRTANQLETIPPPLLDRMDVIQLSGYTEEEKLGIAKKYLAPKQLKEHGLKRALLTFTDKGLRTIIRDYTREAGVRQLERQIAAVCRKSARRVAEGETEKMSADEKTVRAARPAPLRSPDVRKRTSEPGVATGLAVTAVGGDVLFIEAIAYPGGGHLKVTGQLGEVMQESAQAAHSWVRTHALELGIDPNWFGENDVHVHVPAGAVPKDGPSAGITMATAIALDRYWELVPTRCRHDGEITLTGQVLPDRRLRDKVLAAQRAGIAKVIFPKENESALEELPPETREELKFIPVDWIDEVLEVAFEGSLPKVAAARPLSQERKAAASR